MSVLGAMQVDNNVVIADTTDPSVTPSRSPPQWAAPPARSPSSITCHASQANRHKPAARPAL